MKRNFKQLISLTLVIMMFTAFPTQILAETTVELPEACTVSIEACLLEDGHEGECVIDDTDDTDDTNSEIIDTEEENDIEIIDTEEENDSEVVDAEEENDIEIIDAEEENDSEVVGADNDLAVLKDVRVGVSVDDSFYTVDATGKITAFDLDRLTEPTDITIPSTIDGIEITAIGKKSFSVGKSGDKHPNNANIISVVIPDTVIEIEEAAFASCINLESVTLSKNLEKITGINAFQETKITEISFPDTMKIIGKQAFLDCDNLETITFADELTHNEGLIISSLAFKDTGIETITIPNYVTGLYSQSIVSDNLQTIYLEASPENIDFGDGPSNDSAPFQGLPKGAVLVVPKENYGNFGDAWKNHQGYMHIEKYLTYEMTVTFMDYEDNPILEIPAQNKLFNQSFQYEKDESSGIWSINTAYVLPEVPSEFDRADGWTDEKDRYLTVNNDAKVVADRLYPNQVPTATYFRFGEFQQREIEDITGLTEGEDYVEREGGYYAIEPLIWRVLEEDGANYVLTTENNVDTQPFYGDTVESRDWVNSAVRTWLNETFYTDAFSEFERSVIQEKIINDEKSDSWPEIVDEVSVYLLSYPEATTYFQGTPAGAGRGTDYSSSVKAEGIWEYKMPDEWWMRSKYIDSKGLPSFIYMNTDGNVNLLNHQMIDKNFKLYFGVRPAVNIIIPDTHERKGKGTYEDPYIMEELPPVPYTVTVDSDGIGASGSGEYFVDETVTIFAGTKEGYTFAEWQVEPGTVTLADSNEANTTFTMPAKDVTVTATYKEIPPILYFVTVNGGVSEVSEAVEGEVVAITADEPASDKLFDKWTTEDGVEFVDETGISTTFTMPAKDVTVTATYKDVVDEGGSTGGGGGGDLPDPRYIIEASAGMGGTITPDGKVSVRRGKSKTFEIKADEGYEIEDVIVNGKSVGAVTGYTFENIKKNQEIEVTFIKVDNSVALIEDDHRAYMRGYPDNLFKPDNQMTRAEVVVMFSRLLKDPMTPNTAYTSTFSDVDSSMWFANQVAYMEGLGIVQGYPDGTFKPNAPVTRAEFAAIADNFDTETESVETSFVDIDDRHWAKSVIDSVYSRGWIIGYEDNTIRPDSYISRAESVTVTNRVLGRDCGLDGNEGKYTDVALAHWAYGDIYEASSGLQVFDDGDNSSVAHIVE